MNKKFIKQKKNHPRNKHKKKKFSLPPKKTESKTLDEITLDKVGDRVTVCAQVESISQTSGPTLFSITDGTASLILKGFESPGERAHPDINEGNIISALIQINEYNGMLEGEIKSIKKLTGEEVIKFQKSVEEVQKKRAKPPKIDFLIKSQVLEKLKDRFIEAATQIRLAIIQNRPIIVRHHNDTDGYSSGFTLERAIIPLIEKQHGPGKAAWEFYLRAPCAAPYYEIDDSIRDTAMSLRNEAKFSNKMPLIIIADNGSSPEDLLAIKQGKVHGIDFIVIDHHYFDQDVISSEVKVHINPFLVGEDGAQFSAGMLCTELARFIGSVENINQIPAMAALADRIDNPKAVNDYLKIAAKEGYTKDLLHDISTVIDFISAKLRFMEAREYIEVLFGEPREKQKALVSLMAPYIRNLEAKGLEIAKSAVIKEKVGKTSLHLLYVEDVYPRGAYPKPGKSNGLIHDYSQEKDKIKNIISVGVLPDVFTIRASDQANFSVHNFIEFANKNLPKAFVEGGGHKNAGAVKFVPNQQEAMLKVLRKFIKSRQ